MIEITTHRCILSIEIIANLGLAAVQLSFSVTINPIYINMPKLPESASPQNTIARYP